MKMLNYDTLDSTNEEAKRLWHAGELSALSCVTAAHQSAGKGTQGRVWVSPKNAGLYFTVVHIPSILSKGGGDSVWPLSADWTLAAGVACAEALQAELNLTVQLKPVNDLYAEGKKLGGILVESIIEEDVLKVLFTGIGINVCNTERVIADSAISPVSLEALLPPHQFERLQTETLLKALASSVDVWYQRLQADRTTVIATYEKYQLPGTELQYV